jgi:hypothetical protein
MVASVVQLSGQAEESVGTAPGSATSAGDGPLSSAVQLGWRVAELYAQVNDTGARVQDTLLPAHDSLEPADQLELQLLAAVGDARRAGVASTAAGLEGLVAHTRSAPASPEATELFRRRVRDCHVALQKSLWARDEASGKAYELGNGLSDTYSRICRAYREPHGAVSQAWDEVFAHDRIERLKKLLDDLQSRLNPSGVAVVRDHLDTWRETVPNRIAEAHEPPPLARVRTGLRRQTIIWRQLITGDKDPEAYLDSDARAQVGGELRELAWRRYGRLVIPIAAAIFALALVTPKVVHLYEDSPGIASAAAAIAAALGISQASVLLAVRTRLHQWSELLWNRALARKVSETTLVLDTVLPPPPASRSVADLTARARNAVRDNVAPTSRLARSPRTTL